jgi:tRNA A37 threonylcarbamoyladenosine dehydratase
MNHRRDAFRGMDDFRGKKLRLQIGEMAIVEQDDVRDTIINVALHILNQHVSSPKVA